MVRAPGPSASWPRALGFAADRGVGVYAVGLGSNLLVADDGVDGVSVLKLAGKLAEAETRGELLVCGGGAPGCRWRSAARAPGLGGFEFACAIPGTAGGGVWMNAGAYGGDWRAIMARALVVSADRAGWLTPDSLGMSCRHSDLGHGQVVARVEFRLHPATPTRSRPRCVS